MIRLDNTTRKLQAVLAGVITTNQLPIITCWSDDTGSAFTGGTTPINTNSTTAVDIAAAPAASTVRQIDSITAVNADTVSAILTIRYNDNGTLYTLFKATLAVGDQFYYTHGEAVKVLDTNGNVKTGATETLTGDITGSGSGSIATTVAKIQGTVVAGTTGTGNVVFQTSPTLTTPVIASIVNTGTLTLPTSTDTLVGKATTDTLTNKTYDTTATGNVFKIATDTVTTVASLAALFTARTIQVFTSGSGTYTTPAGCVAIKRRMIGGGGGGGGGGTVGSTAGSAGGATTFGALTANGGGGGSAGSGTAGASNGGSASGGDVNFTGSSGDPPPAAVGTVGVVSGGGNGGQGPFGGGGVQNLGNTGQAALANTGSGGGGGGVNGALVAGGGGAAGGYLEKIIGAPSATYSYAVGAGGAGGGAGTNGSAGGAGAAGIIIVEEFYV